jgi:hypothetical protein
VEFEELRSHNLRASWRIRKALDHCDVQIIDIVLSFLKETADASTLVDQKSCAISSEGFAILSFVLLAGKRN